MYAAQSGECSYSDLTTYGSFQLRVRLTIPALLIMLVPMFFSYLGIQQRDNSDTKANDYDCSEKIQRPTATSTVTAVKGDSKSKHVNCHVFMRFLVI